MAAKDVAVQRGRDMVFTRPQDLPEEWYAMWEGLVTDMRQEAQALPMNTMMLLLVERIATTYVNVRRFEGQPREIDWDQLRGMQKLWLDFTGQFATQLARNSQTPEQRFVASFKAALSAALRKVGPDATVRELMPVLAEAMTEFDV